MEFSLAENAGQQTHIHRRGAELEGEGIPLIVCNQHTVFHAEGVETVKNPEKTVETEVKEVKEITDRKEVENFKGLVEEAKEKHYPQPDISEENKVRRKLIEMMSKEEFDVIVSQIKQAARMEVERETLSFLEKQGVDSGSKEIKAVSKEVAPSAEQQSTSIKLKK